MDMKDLYWAAGFLEGDGYFSKSSRSRPGDYMVGATNADEDVLQHLSCMFGHKVYPYAPGMYGPLTKKKMFRWHVSGSKAIGIMMTLYPLMSLRRKSQIRDVIAAWKSVPVAKKYRTARGLTYTEIHTRKGV